MPLASFLAGTIGKSILGGAMSAVASNLLKPKVQNPRIDFKQMRDDATAAGFNPLTAMRSGAMSGYMIPALSKQSFVGQFLSGAIRAGTDAFLNKDIDLYNEEIRKLNLQERKLNIGIMSKQLANMDAPISTSIPKNVYDGTGRPEVTTGLLSAPYGELSTNINEEITASEVKPILKTYTTAQGNTFSSILNNDEFMESVGLAAQGVMVDAATKLGIYGRDNQRAMNEIIFGPLNRKMNNLLGYD
jgi:hypothetical protein